MFLAQTRAFAALTSQTRLFSTYCSKTLNIKHGKKHCSGLIVVIHRQRHHIVFIVFLFFNSPFFLSSLDQMLLLLQTFSTFSFSVLLLRGPSSLLRGQVNSLCIIHFFYRRSDLTRSKCLFHDRSFAKVFANMMCSF